MKRISLAVALTLLTIMPNSYAQSAVGATVVNSIEPFTIMPALRNVAVSPNGQKLAFVRATSKDGDYIIEIADLTQAKSDPVRLGADRMLVSGVNWLSDDKVLVIFRQLLKTGATKRWVNKVAITNADGKGGWMVPFKDNPRAGFTVVDLLPDNPDEILVEADLDDSKRYPNVVRFNVNTGRTVTVLRGNDKVNGGFVTDADGEIRAGSGFNLAENGIDLYVRAKGSDDWKLLKTISPKSRETFNVAGISNENFNEVYVVANMGQDTAGLYIYDIVKDTYSERLFGVNDIDVDGVAFDRKGNLLGVQYTDKWPTYYHTDERTAQIYAGLQAQFPDQLVRLASSSLDENTVVVTVTSPDNPGSFYLLKDNKLLSLGSRQPALNKDMLSEVKYVSYKARDGLDIKAYITAPAGKGPFPAIVLPHGGPWVRDTVVFDEWAQLLANHGYIVIQPNYRGSTGYGLQHWKAGDNNWGLAMQDELDDAAAYLVSSGLTEKDKVAIFGWSYGGYAAFAASVRENSVYRCAIAGAGVADLSKVNATLNDNRYLARLQRPTISGLNPIERTKNLNIPLLIVHGDIDVRVPVSHSRDFVEKLDAKVNKFRYVELEDADHFYDTLFRNHKVKFYGELLSWLANECALPTSKNTAAAK